MSYKVFFIFFLIIFSDVACNTGVTNVRALGRLGDQLLAYCKAKYVSYKNGCPFYFMPFIYSDLLSLHYNEKKADMSNGLHQIDLYYSENNWEKPLGILGLYEYCILEPAFKQELKRMIAPKQKIDYFIPPKDIFSIAVHVRKGGGFDPPLQSAQSYKRQYNVDYEYFFLRKKRKDNIVIFKNISQRYILWKAKYMRLNSQSIRSAYADRGAPCKFPPEQFYVDQLKKVSEYLGDVPIYVHIFTDNKDSESVAERIRVAVAKDNLIFGSRKDNHKYYNNFMEDLCSMALFDCLIRPESSFSTIAQFIGDHKLILYPLLGKWVNRDLIISSVCFIDRFSKKTRDVIS